MVELKTLKEIENSWEGDCLCHIHHPIELKQEAIKWIKDGYFITQGTFGNVLYTKYERIAIEKWIKHFFNITEEDLK